MATRGMVEDGLTDLTPTEQDALSISNWLEVAGFRPVPIVPASAVDGFEFAHDNADAWPLVTLPPGVEEEWARKVIAAYAWADRFLSDHVEE